MIEAYCTPLSVGPGDSISLHVSTDAETFSLAVSREGAEQISVAAFDGVVGAHREIPQDASANGCGWPVSFVIPVSADWRSGYYSVVLTNDAGDRADAFFVVRPSGGANASFLLALSTNTYNAYNDWGGPSLYTGGSRVSFERPMARGFLAKPEPFSRMTDAGRPFDPDALGYRKWARPLGLSDWSGGAGWWNW